MSGPDALRLTVEVLVETGRQGRLATWQLDVDRGPAGWRIVAAATLSVVEGLFRLALDETTQYRARNLVITAEDLELRLDDGVVFFANVPSGATVALLLGKGEMVFSPDPEAERRQIALLTGGPALRQSFEAAMIRLNPADQASRLSTGQLSAVPVDRNQLLRAQDLFADGDRQVIQRGPGRSQPRHVVADSVPRQLSGGSPHEEVRHADLRARRQRPGRHLRV